MKYYCGLDVSLNSTAVCIVNERGDVVKEGDVPSDPESIDVWLSRLKLPLERVGLEAGNLSPWLCHELLAKGWAAICIETRHAKAALQAQQVKTDRNDARGIAHIMRTGWYREVHVKSHESQKLRVLLSNRRCLVDKRVEIDAQIRGTLKVFGLKVGKIARNRFEWRIRELIEGDEDLREYIGPMLDVRDHLARQAAKLEKIILDIVKADEVCQRLMTIPGVGPMTSLSYKTYVDRPERFTKSRAVGAALGLTPRKYASGETDYNGGITKCGDPFLRHHLFEASKVMMGRAGKSCALKTWGLRIAQRKSKKSACVAVSRKLAVLMHAMWRDATVFTDASVDVLDAVAA